MGQSSILSVKFGSLVSSQNLFSELYSIEGLHGRKNRENRKNRNKFCMKIDFISQRREIVLFLPSNMAAMETPYCKSSLQCDVRRVYTLVVQCSCH